MNGEPVGTNSAVGVNLVRRKRAKTSDMAVAGEQGRAAVPQAERGPMGPGTAGMPPPGGPGGYGGRPMRRPAPPSSGTPLRDYLANGPRPGVDEGYTVLPRSLAETMPVAWQQQMASLLSQFHRMYAHLDWPAYRVVPSRYELLVDLDEDQLAEVGCIVEIDAEGELVYRESDGRRIEEPENTSVLVSCPDPLPGEQANATESTPPRGIPIPQQQESVAPESQRPQEGQHPSGAGWT